MDDESNGSHWAWAGLRGSKRIEREDGWPLLRMFPPEGELMSARTDTPDTAAVMRMVDFRIPLPWLMSLFIAGVMALIGMYYQLQAVNATLGEVKTTLAATTEVITRLSGQQALLQYRLEKLEAVDRRSQGGAK